MIAGMSAVPNIQRHAESLGTITSTSHPTPVPASAPTAWKPKAPMTSRPRFALGVLSEMIMCAVG